jgi:hypothetical protein
MTEKFDSMLEKVRALLAKADDPSVGAAESDLFRAKADELMTRYAIEQWHLDQANTKRNQSAKPIRKDWALSIWSSSKFRSDLYWMLQTLASHCRCVIGHRGIDYHTRTMPVYGLESDLDWLNMLFTTVALEVAKHLDPAVNANGNPGEEVFKQRQAGIDWPKITMRMFEAGLVKPTKKDTEKINTFRERWGALDGPITWSDLERSGAWEDMKNRLANWNRRYIKEHGLEGQRNYVRPEIYQRSFIAGFRDEIERRIYDMAERTRTSYDSDHDAGSFALAVRDIRTQALDLYKQEFPPPPPVAIDPNRKPSKLPKLREVVLDSSAIRAGRAAARDVSLSNAPGERLKQRKDLES